MGEKFVPKMEDFDMAEPIDIEDSTPLYDLLDLYPPSFWRTQFLDENDEDSRVGEIPLQKGEYVTDPADMPILLPSSVYQELIGKDAIPSYFSLLLEYSPKELLSCPG